MDSYLKIYHNIIITMIKSVMEGCCKYPGNCVSNHKCISCQYFTGGLKYCDECLGWRNNRSTCHLRRCLKCNCEHKCYVCGSISNTYDVCNHCSDYAMARLRLCNSLI
jgi:hypothetical protein